MNRIKSYLISFHPFTLVIILTILFVPFHFLKANASYTIMYLLIETLSIFMAFSITLTLWYTYDYSKGFFQILGSSFLAAGVLKLFHTLSFPGMPEFITTSSETKAMWFWIMSRFIVAVSLFLSGLTAARAPGLNMARSVIFGVFGGITTALLIFVFFYSQYYNDVLISLNTGIFNILIIILLLLGIVFFKISKSFSPDTEKLLSAGMICGIFSELVIALQLGEGSTFSLLGHLYKLLAYALFFHALFGQTVRLPYIELEKLMDQTVSAISRALDGRDNYTFNHSSRVAEYACVIGQILKVDKEMMKNLKLAGLLHDIGKIAVPDSVLNKAGPLTPSEKEIIKLHPLKGADILEPIERLQILRGISEHHERIDSKGYPLSKPGEEISMEGRILAVADTFDALTSNRVYRAKRSKEEALKVINEVAGTQLDETVVNAFVKAEEIGLIDKIMDSYKG